MRIVIVQHSVHHHNTEKLAEAMARSVHCDVITLHDARDTDLSSCDLMGIGSGIFFGKHHPRVLEFALEHRPLPKACFVFSTAGIRWLYPMWHRPLVTILERSGCRVIAQFCSPGWDTVGPLKYIGGIHRGRPNAKDLESASRFAVKTVEQLQLAESLRLPVTSRQAVREEIGIKSR
jgi:flavodoxin